MHDNKERALPFADPIKVCDARGDADRRPAFR